MMSDDDDDDKIFFIVIIVITHRDECWRCWWCKKFFHQKIFHKKNFWVKKNFNVKNFFTKKNLSLKNLRELKNFRQKKIFIVNFIAWRRSFSDETLVDCKKCEWWRNFSWFLSAWSSFLEKILKNSQNYRKNELISEKNWNFSPIGVFFDDFWPPRAIF